MQDTLGQAKFIHTHQFFKHLSMMQKQCLKKKEKLLRMHIEVIATSALDMKSQNVMSKLDLTHAQRMKGQTLTTNEEDE